MFFAFLGQCRLNPMDLAALGNYYIAERRVDERFGMSRFRGTSLILSGLSQMALVAFAGHDMISQAIVWKEGRRGSTASTSERSYYLVSHRSGQSQAEKAHSGVR